MKYCLIQNCGNVLSSRSELETCPVCRSSFSYWKRKRPAQILARRKALAKYQDRLVNLT